MHRAPSVAPTTEERSKPKVLTFSVAAAQGTTNMGDWLVTPQTPILRRRNGTLGVHLELYPNDAEYVLLHNGTGTFRYRSGRHAMVVSEGVEGTCAIVWSDASPPTLLALYHPQTRLTCFHPSGAARLLCDDEGYTSFSPTGAIIHTWRWSQPAPAAIRLAEGIRARVLGPTDIQLVVALHALPARVHLVGMGCAVVPGNACSTSSVPADTALARATSRVDAALQQLCEAVDAVHAGQPLLPPRLSTVEFSQIVVTTAPPSQRASMVTGPAPTPSNPAPHPPLVSQSSRVFSVSLPSPTSAPLATPSVAPPPLLTRPTPSSHPVGSRASLSSTSIHSSVPDSLGSRPPLRRRAVSSAPALRFEARSEARPPALCPARLAASRGLTLGPGPWGGGVPDLGRVCLCTTRRVPLLPAHVYDAFLRAVPPTQLVLVLGPDPPPDLEAAVEGEYRIQHRSRAQPCAHASVDAFRIVRHPGSPAPLLAAARGAMLMYYGGRLVFAGAVLDGRGCTPEHLRRQMVRTRRAAEQGFELPHDLGTSPR